MRRHLLLLLAIPVPLMIFAGCDGDTSSGPDGLLVEEAREVLTVRLEAAYEGRDHAELQALLHPDFRFTFLDGEAPGGSVEGAWGKTTELAVMLELFGSPSVDSIGFDISIPDEELTVIEGTGEYDYRASTVVGWKVTMEAAGKAGDTLFVAAIHTYHLRKDPEGGAFRIYDQVENAIASGGAYFGSGVDFTSWGDLKKIFHEPMSLPATRTIKGTVTVDSTGGAMQGVVVTAGDHADTTDAYGRFEVADVPGTVHSVVFFHPAMYDEVVTVNGGDEVVRIDVALSSLGFHETPAAIITEDLPTAYSREDSVQYAALLDSRYRFELLTWEVDPNDPNPWWDLTEELRIAGNMFSHRYNDDHQRVDRIKLEMTERSMTPLVDVYPDQPGGETWHEVTALVDLLVVVEDPDDVDGVINFVVTSDQIFVVRPDPGHEGRYLIYRQTDQEPINKTPKPGTETSTWGSVKGLFR
ncbi:MAG: carboxypeptidase-like regulatory domain-containing protein [Candidatus Eisenbacteria bacterium]